MKSNTKLSSFIRGVGAITIANILTKATTFFLLPLYTAHIKPEQMGIYETIVGLVGFVFPLLVMALDSSFSAFYFDIDTEEHKTAVLSTISGTLFLSSLLLVALIPIAPFLSELVFGTKENALPIVIALSGGIFNMWYLPFALTLRMNNKLTLYAVISLAGSLISIGTNVFLIHFRNVGFQALLISGTLMNFVLLGLYYSFSGYTFRRKSFDKALLKRMLSYSLPLLPLLLINWILSASDRFILLNYSGSSETGIYGIADKFPAVLSLFTNGITISYSAFAFSSVKDENAKTQFISIQAITHAVLVVITIFVSSISKEIVGIMADDAYHAAGQLLGPLLLGQVCHISSVLISYAFAFVKKSYLNVIPAAIGASINVCLNFLFIPRYGAYAAALTTMVGYSCVLFVTYLLAKKYFNCKYLIVRTALTLIITTLAILLIDGKPLVIRLSIAASVFIVVLAVYFKPIQGLLEKTRINETSTS